MPEYYSSIGEAVGAAMQHNIRLAHRSAAPGSDKPLQVRHLPNASADPYSVRGMISRLHEDASPDEVAGIIKEVNGALAGALPELTELVASAADWTRARLDFDDPHHNPTFETWTRLAAAYGMLQDVREQLEAAEDGLATCPAERTAPGTTRWSTSYAAGSCSTMSSMPRLLLRRPLPGTSIQTGSGPPAPPRRAPEHRRRLAVRRPPQHLCPRLVLPADPAETFRFRRPGAPP